MYGEGDAIYRQLYESIRDGILSTDMDGRIVAANGAFREMLGYSLEELQRLTYQQLTPEAYRLMEEDVVANQIRTRGYSDEYEKEYIRKDGTVFPVSLRTWLIADDAGRPTGMWAIVRDITERTVYSRRLDEARRNWERSFRSISDAMFLVDIDLNVLQHNTAFAELVGREGQDLRGMKCYELVHALEAPPDFCVTCAAARTGETCRAELFEPHLDKHLDATADPTFDEEGNFEFALHIIRDITGRKRAEAELEESYTTFKGVIDSLDYPVFSVDTRYRYTSFNLAHAATMKALFGCDVELGGSLLEYMTVDEDREKAKANIDRALSGETVLEEAYSGEEGLARICVEVRHSPIFGHSRRVIGVVMSVRDITERKRSEEALKESEERFRSIIENAPFGYYRVTDDGLWQYVNPVWESMHGYSAEEVIGRPFEITQPESSVEAAREMVARALSGESLSGEFPRLGSEGAIEYHSFNIQPVRHEGEIVAIEGFIEDITERKRAQEELAAAERSYRELAETLPQVVFELDSSGMITYVNRSAFEMFGYSQDDFDRGIHALDVIEEVDRSRVSGAIDKVMDGRSDGAVREYLVRRKDGSTFPAIVYSSLVADDAGNRNGIRGILTDISERKRYEEELERANVELEGFAHTVSHDLRGPLTVIAFASELIQQNIGQPQTVEVASAMDEAAQLLARNVSKANSLIVDLLSLAQAGQAPSGVEDVDVDETVESVLDENAAALRRKRIRVEVGPDLGTVRANPTHVYQIFANLIGNAVNHGKGSTSVIQVRRMPDETQNVHRYLVRDDGSGIPPEAVDKIFIPFFKGGDGGTGIGLSTVQKAISVYDGWIRAYNDDGACFEFAIKDWDSA